MITEIADYAREVCRIDMAGAPEKCAENDLALAVNRRVVGSSPTCGANSCLTYSRLLIPTSRYVDSPGVSGIPAEHKFEKGGFETLPFSFRDSITKICLSRHST